MYHGPVTTSPQPVGRAAQAERTRLSILSTARRLFAENGYAATSLQQIADAQGIQKANVYYYFRTKQAILDVLLDERISALEALIERAEHEPDRARRRDLVVEGFIAEVVVAHREIAPVDVADPAVRSQPGVAERLAAIASRAVGVLFGEHPSVDELAGFALVQNLRPALQALDRLPDGELRSALERLCRRLLPD